MITSVAPPEGVVQEAYDASGGFSLTASGGAAPYRWSWTTDQGSLLPPGLGLSTDSDGTDTISGIPTTARLLPRDSQGDGLGVVRSADERELYDHCCCLRADHAHDHLWRAFVSSVKRESQNFFNRVANSYHKPYSTSPRSLQCRFQFQALNHLGKCLLHLVALLFWALSSHDSIAIRSWVATQNSCYSSGQQERPASPSRDRNLG